MNPILTGRSSGKGQAIVPVAAMLIAGLSLVACTGGGDPEAAPTSTSKNEADDPASTTALEAAATTAAPSGGDSGEPATSSSTLDADKSLEEALAEAKEWPLRQQLAQLMFVGVNADGTDGKAGTGPAVVQALIDAGVGGVFVGRKEVGVFASDVMLNAQDNAVPPLVATDGEGGIVDLSLEIADPLPPAREMASWDDARIQEAGASRGEDLCEPVSGECW